jgi:hypothetical protein
VDYKKVTSIPVKNYLLYSSVTFYCEVYDYAQESIVGNLEYTFTSDTTKDDVTISYTGDDTFRYDANGDITIEDSEKERTLQVALTWRDGVGAPYTIEWIGPDG